MNNLRKKIFFTIFTIISSFGLFFALFFLFENYQREYKDIENGLMRMRNVVNHDEHPFLNETRPKDDNLHNRMIMDYDLYTFILDDDNQIIEQISHSDKTISNDILTKSKEVIANNKGTKLSIHNLYFNRYVYHFRENQFLMIMDIQSINKRLQHNFLVFVIFLIVMEIVAYFITRKLTNWITRPVEESFRSQKDFITNASHELKTPLAVMMASIDCLTPSKKNEKWIDHLKSEAERMNHLITRLLDLSKSEDILAHENFAVENLSFIIEKRALIFESLAFEKKIKIKTEIDDDIKFLCNKESIDEMASILIDNAIYHGTDGSEVVISLSKEKANIILTVTNAGAEIPREECDKIFERFYRVDKSRHRMNRYGLGLAIAKNIVMNHHGVISASSKDGFTTFKVVFKKH